ncbi:MAG TPA: zinc ribbon domain-containing protein [Phototrophicaceae bacterium]|nr:zinc ribbon domain-containing protein [Phototrophicaceae bacterium]
MPLYEYDCPGCGQPFEKLVRSSTPVAEIVCPNCGNHHVKKKISTFAVKGGGSGSSASVSAAPTCAPGGT